MPGLKSKERTVSNEESEVQKNDSKSNMGI